MTEPEMVDMLKRILVEKMEASLPDDVDFYSLKLLNLGINSITYIKLLVELEKELGIEFPDSDLKVGEDATIKDLIILLKQYVSVT